jgi:hypothetical protein
MVRLLQLVDPEISKNGNLTDWFHIAKERPDWDKMIESLDTLDDNFNFDPGDNPTPEFDSNEDQDCYS